MSLGLSKALEEVDYQDFDEIKNKVRHSPSYKETANFLKKKDSSISEENAMDLSSVLTGLLTMAWMDSELTKLEVKYMVRELKGWCKLEREERQHLIDIHSHLVHEKAGFEEHTAWHLAWLKRNLDNRKCEKFFEDLVIISRSDLDIERREVNLLKKIAKFLDIDHEKQDEFIVNAKFIVIQRLEEAAENESMEVLEKPYSIPRIVLESID